jgi:hypothetical protein
MLGVSGERVKSDYRAQHVHAARPLFGARDRRLFEVVVCSALAAADAWPLGGLVLFAPYYHSTIRCTRNAFPLSFVSRSVT